MVKAEPKFFSWYLCKYIAREILPSFMVGTLLFLLIMLMFQVIRLSEFVVVHQVGLKDVGKLSSYLMLSFIPIAIPIAFLFSVLMGISRSNSEGEILALQTNGISLLQVFAPLGIFSILISLLCVYLALYTVPTGNRKFELLVTRLGNERVMSSLKQGVFQESFHDLVLLAETVIPLKNELRRVFIYDDRDENYPLAITARAGILKNNVEEGVLTLRLTNGTILVDRTQRSEVQQKIDFDVYDINLQLPGAGSFWRDYSPPSYNFPQLKEHLNKTRADPVKHRQLQVELHRRFSLSFSCVVFAALGMFVGVQSQRGIRSTAIILCLLVGLIYWLSYLAANAVAVGGWMPPGLTIWMPNLFFLWVAYVSYRRYAKSWR